VYVWVGVLLDGEKDLSSGGNTESGTGWIYVPLEGNKIEGWMEEEVEQEKDWGRVEV